ncbi:MAG: hypothetical protein KHZ58_04975 [Hungatella hathewayi]|nr:hypothetical protein [Hungatella hathewayi]
MKNKRTLLFQLGAVLLLLIIAGIMMMIGRGHTVYMDNVTMDYNGQTYESFYKVEVFVDGERIGKLYDKERAMSVNIGQTFDVSFEVTPNKGDSVMVYNVSLSLPYNMDGIVINLPTYLAGLSEDAFLSEFVSKVEETEAEEETTVDEFGIGGDI